MVRTKNIAILVVFIVVIAFFTMPPSYSYTTNSKPANYTEPDEFLSGYFNGLQDRQEQVEKALAIVDVMYPDWSVSYGDSFDCSEMTEYLLYFFTKCGIKADYCQSDELWHCWLEVPLDDNGADKLLIESTNLSIIPKDGWQFYYKYNDVRYNRYMRPDEVDWWTRL